MLLDFRVTDEKRCDYEVFNFVDELNFVLVTFFISGTNTCQKQLK